VVLLVLAMVHSSEFQLECKLATMSAVGLGALLVLLLEYRLVV